MRINVGSDTKRIGRLSCNGLPSARAYSSSNANGSLTKTSTDVSRCAERREGRESSFDIVRNQLDNDVHVLREAQVSVRADGPTANPPATRYRTPEASSATAIASKLASLTA